MRYAAIIFLGAFFTFSCVKQNSKNPVPQIEFLELSSAGKSPYTNSDTAVIVLSYEDGDGDLFVNENTDDENIIFTPYSYKANLNQFTADITPNQDTIRIQNKIRQPDNGYYKGKSIRGKIYMPIKQFRLNDKVKIIKFIGFMTDMKKHKSNVVSSPVYTLTF